jgi:RNA polymerase sigma factor (sigma-70 family)
MIRKFLPGIPERIGSSSFNEGMAGRNDTEIGGVASAFPSTQWSVLHEARDRCSPGYRQAMAELCRVYWKPIYLYLRSSRAMDNERAKDLTQLFLLEILEGDLLSRFSPDHGSFRAYLRGALRLFLLEDHRDENALKRGGGRTVVSIDREEEGRLAAKADSAGADPEQLFDRQWADTVLEQAVAALREELAGKVAFRVFDRYELNPPPEGPPSYAELAREFSLKESDISNQLMASRKRLRELVVARLRGLVSSESEVAAELLRLFSK